LITGTVEVQGITAQFYWLHLDFVKQYCQISNVGLASTYLACLVNTYAVRGRTKYCAGVLGQLRGRAAAQLRGNIDTNVCKHKYQPVVQNYTYSSVI